MNKKLVISYLSLVICLLAIPLISFAAINAPNLPYWGPFLSCHGAGCGFDDMIQTFLNIVYFGITISLYFAAPVLAAWGGVMILISGANPSGRDKGKKILTGTVIGVVIVLSAFLILKTFISLLGLTGIGGFTP